MTESRRGLWFGIGAYVFWGLFPLYWGLLKPSGPVEILAHRIIWSLVLVVAILTVTRGWTWMKALPLRRRVIAGLVTAAALIAVNWGIFIYGINSGKVVETSLGYFINPLVSVLLGVFVLRERLRGVQWSAMAMGAVAVAVLTVNYGRLPWIALVLAVSFGLYGLIKKIVGVPALEGLAIETMVLVPLALSYLVWLSAAGQMQFGHVSAVHTVLVMAAGVVTAVPLLLFAGAANRISLTTLGVLQYIGPVLQFLIGVFILHESMPATRWIGFVLVWAALMIFTLDSLRHHRRQLAQVAELARVPA